MLRDDPVLYDMPCDHLIFLWNYRILVSFGHLSYISMVKECVPKVKTNSLRDASLTSVLLLFCLKEQYSVSIAK